MTDRPDRSHRSRRSGTGHPGRAQDLTLVADIGGTNSRLALARDGRLLAAYLRRQAGARPGAIALAVAGTVRRGRARMTNLGWEVEARSLRRATGAERVLILNDLQAQGHALAHLPARALRLLLAAGSAAPADPADSRLVIGLGTGFNASPVHRSGRGHLVPAAEAGHAALPRGSESDQALTARLAPGPGGPVIEDLLCGPGLSRAYGLFAPGREASPAQVLARIGREPAADAAIGLFARLLGRVVADLALLHLPFGGIFLAGGTARAVAPHLLAAGFAEAFHEHRQLRDMLRQFPLWVIQDDFAALTGCAASLPE